MMSARRLTEKGEAKLETIMEHLTESHLDAVGGYPYDWTLIGETVIVAALDPAKEYNRTMIKTYNLSKLFAWYDRAEALTKEDPENYLTIEDALSETEDGD